MDLYIVKMNRWGDDELHSYIEGVYDSKEKAKTMGKLEQEFRDNKYEPQILLFPLNEPRNQHNVIKSETNK